MKSPVQFLTIDAEFEGQRIDNFLITQLKSVPRTRVYRLLRKGEVRVNKKRAAPSYRLQAGDEVRVPPLEMRDEQSKPTLSAPDHLKALLKSRILFEDKSLMIINKPAGIAVHGGSKMPWGIIETLKEMYPQFPHLELAHRLDRDTSGCLVLVKRRSVLRELHELLRKGQLTKEYYALTQGAWRKNELRVEAPLLKNNLSSGERIVRVHAEGKASITLFEPLTIYQNATLVKARLLTGRTHQIRVHAQFRGHPIAGDEKYGDKDFNKIMRKNGVKRLFLHAHTIQFTLPTSGQTIRVEAPLDNDLTDVLNHLI